MKVKCKIIRQVYPNKQSCASGDFRILGCELIEPNPNIKMNKYGNFTILGDLAFLSVNKEYILEVEEQEPQNGRKDIQYRVKSVPSLTLESIESITDEMELEILKDITTESQAEYINNAYKNFIRLILSGKEDEIDTKKIFNVGQTRMKIYIREINEKYKYYYIMDKNRQYNLNMQDCKNLCKVFGTIDEVNNIIEKCPYYSLITVCNKKFDEVDRIIINFNKKFKESDERLEYLLLDLLNKNEADGSTYMDANELAEYVNGIDSGLISKMKNITLKSPKIYYDEVTKNIAKMDTYLAECSVSQFVKDKIKSNKVLDWNWQNFKEIKDGKMTEEQSNVLKEFCEHNFLVLDAGSGCGKTSVVKAVLDMCDEYNYSYCCLAPTGKASARLTAQTLRQSSTIHRKVLSESITEDVLLIDEYSLLSLDLMNMIVKSINNPDIRVFLVGDVHQLPPISAGRIAKDLLESDICPCCTLTYCFRFDEGGASYVSNLTMQGKFYLTDEQCQQDELILGKNKDYTFIKSDGTIEQVINEYMKLIKRNIKPKDICVLTPYNVHEFGATNINNLIQLEVNQPKPNEQIMKSKQNQTEITFRKNDLVMNTVNNYNALSLDNYNLIQNDENNELTEADVIHTSIFNGQMGKILNVYEKVLMAQLDEEIIVFNKKNCYNLLLAYASNPFKMQGSQNQYIINLVLPQHKKALNRQLLYTSQTRQQIELIEIGDIETMKYAVSKSGDDNRKTMLKDLLNTYEKEVEINEAD